MNNITTLALISALVSGASAFLITPLVIKKSKQLGIIDDPKHHKHPKVIHTYPVPRGGGFAIFLAILVSTLIFLPLDKHVKGILTGIIIIAFMGILDDKYDLNPYLRLVVQFLAAGMPIFAGIGISFITNPFNGILDLSQPQIVFNLLGETRSIWILSDIFALVWIVALMNFVNWGAKGIDGQLPGVVSIAAITIALLSLRFSADITQWPVIILATITAGAYLGFLPWNFYPQKIMPGFGGSNIAGYLLGVLSILSTAKVGTLLVVLGIPIVDSVYTIVRRVASGKSPVWGDRGHLHHRLLDAGLSKRQVVLLYWIATLILGVLALNLNASYKLYTIVGIIIFIGGFLIWLTLIKKPQKQRY